MDVFHADKALYDGASHGQDGTDVVVVPMAVRAENHVGLSLGIGDPYALKGVKDHRHLRSPHLETGMTVPNYFHQHLAPSFKYLSAAKVFELFAAAATSSVSPLWGY